MMYQIRLLKILIKNIKRCYTDMYNVTIIYNGIDIGHRAETIGAIKYEFLNEELIRKLNKYISDDNKFTINLYQSCEFENDLLIFIKQNWYKNKEDDKMYI